jgi:hypothetical protein
MLVSNNTNDPRTQARKPPQALLRLTRRARERNFAAAWRLVELELLQELGRRPWPAEVAARLRDHPDRHLADIKTRSAKVLCRRWARLQTPTLTRGDHELRELLARLDARNPRLRRVRDLVLSGLRMKAAEQRLPPLPEPQTEEEREVFALYRARLHERDEQLERVRRRLVAFLEANPPARPSAPLPDADVIDLRERIHTDGVGETRGPPGPKTADASAPTTEAPNLSELCREDDATEFTPLKSLLSRKNRAALSRPEGAVFMREAMRLDRGWQRLDQILGEIIGELTPRFGLPAASRPTATRPTDIFRSGG